MSKKDKQNKILIFILTKMNNALFVSLSSYNLFSSVKNLGYVPVGLGSKTFLMNGLQTQMEIIFHKNPNYGEHSFYYWLWKTIK